ncbi:MULTISPECIES: diguanylate cyclase [unclassified Butyrivibrio]|uniref:diguanylate cyclase n=1 Tax=unclassified Butyrivibrio TaxID=2639466 RepID=UPI0003B7A2F1|nr:MULTISPECIES: GGDEF domain-containing protein [unclassified Butyrivibrio]
MINGKKIVALCTYRIHDSQVFTFITEFSNLLSKFDCRLFIYAINAEIGNKCGFLAETSVYDLIPFDKVDAVVIMDEKIKSRETVRKIIDNAKKANVPAIVIDGEYDDVSTINFDYRKGFETVVRHVIEEHGARRPHFMAGKHNNKFSDERIDVFKQVLAENNIPFDDSMLSYGDFWSVPARAATEEIIKRDVLPDAIICANDIMAINVCDVLTTHMIMVPGEVMVTGFDGLDEASLATPGVTTAKCSSVDLAKVVIQVVKDTFAGKGLQHQSVIPEFLPNESCGCPRMTPSAISAVHSFNNRFYHHQDDIHIMQDFTSRIISSNSLEDCLDFLRSPLSNNMCIILDAACLNKEVNYFLEDTDTTDKILIYDSYIDEDRVTPFDPDTVVPHLDELIEKGYPLIFNALEYMSKSPGYICYSFPRYDMIDYSKTSSLTSTIGMGLGSYINMRYQLFIRDKIQRMYQNDALTGFYTRLAFYSKYEDLKENPENIGKDATVIMADLNGLKKINDNLGHSAGDSAIKAVATRLKDNCPEDALCLRHGGDEMVAFIIGPCDPEKIKAGVDKDLQKDSKELGLKVSAAIGYYVTKFDSNMDLNKAINAADEEMYKIKKQSR